MSLQCPLCFQASARFFADPKSGYLYFQCGTCELRFLEASRHLPAALERARYETHENNIHDLKYREFLKPVFNMIHGRVKPGARGLDYGCGPASALGEMFRECGYAISLYDPFFANDPKALETKYDFITATEAIEHFYRPGDEFRRLRGLLNPGGLLAVMTHLFDEKIDFANWYYRRDPTHVCFYSLRTFQWIKGALGFSEMTFDGARSVCLKI